MYFTKIKKKKKVTFVKSFEPPFVKRQALGKLGQRSSLAEEGQGPRREGGWFRRPPPREGKGEDAWEGRTLGGAEPIGRKFPRLFCQLVKRLSRGGGQCFCGGRGHLANLRTSAEGHGKDVALQVKLHHPAQPPPSPLLTWQLQKAAEAGGLRPRHRRPLVPAHSPVVSSGSLRSRPARPPSASRAPEGRTVTQGPDLKETGVLRWSRPIYQQGCRELGLAQTETNIHDHLYPQLTSSEPSLCSCRHDAFIPDKVRQGSCSCSLCLYLGPWSGKLLWLEQRPGVIRAAHLEP